MKALLKLVLFCLPLTLYPQAATGVGASGANAGGVTPASGGSGTITAGTTNTLPKYTASTTIGDSKFTDDGTTPKYNTVELPTISSTSTLTNKRITPRVTTISSSATPTVNTDNCDAVTITALAAAITSMTTNLSGTPNNFDKLVYRIKDDGNARAITWGASFATDVATLPTTTVAGKGLKVVFWYDSVAAVWQCMATGSTP